MKCQGRQCGVTASSDQPSWWSIGAPISVSVLGHNKHKLQLEEEERGGLPGLHTSSPLPVRHNHLSH